MMRSVLLVLAFCLALAPAAMASSVFINFNDESAQAGGDLTMSQDDYGSAFLNGRFLYNDDREVTLGSAGLKFVGDPGNVPGLELGVGAQVYVGEAGEGQDWDFGAVGVGALVGYAPPVLGGIGFEGRLYYAPKIFSFLDSEGLTETAFNVGYAITPRIRILAEYQNIRAKVEDVSGRHRVDEEIRIGFAAKF